MIDFFSAGEDPDIELMASYVSVHIMSFQVNRNKRYLSPVRGSIRQYLIFAVKNPY